jgi:hypothetical protein
MSKIPLKSRKSIKTFQEKAEPLIKKASAAFGKELTLIDNTADIFATLQTAGKSEDYLFNLGDPLLSYVDQFVKFMVEFCKNADNKEQLEAELVTAKFGIRIIGDDADEKYLKLEDGVLWMEAKASWFGSYLSYYDETRLCSILGSSDSMPLNTRKSLRTAQTKIDDYMKKSSKLFGAELSWVDNYQELYDKLNKAGKSQDYLFDLGTPIILYADQLMKCFEEFCKDADNKEALQEVLTSGKCGVRFKAPEKESDEYFVIEDGTLWMETQENWFGSYLSYYSSDCLEKKL